MFKMYTRIFSDFFGPKQKRPMIEQLSCQKTHRTLRVIK